VEFSRECGLSFADEIKNGTIELIQGARVSINRPDDEAGQEQWLRAKITITALFERLIFGAINVLKSNNGPLSRASWNYIMRPLEPKVKSPPPSPAVTTSPPPQKPVPAVPPKRNVDLRRSGRIVTQQEIASFAAAETQENNARNPKIFVSSDAPPALIKMSPRGEEDPAKREVADKILKSLMGNFPMFKAEWLKQTPDSQERNLKSMITDHLRTLSPSTPKQSEEDEDISDLRKLLDTTDITKISYELRSLTRRLDKKITSAEDTRKSIF